MPVALGSNASWLARHAWNNSRRKLACLLIMQTNGLWCYAKVSVGQSLKYENIGTGSKSLLAMIAMSKSLSASKHSRTSQTTVPIQNWRRNNGSKHWENQAGHRMQQLPSGNAHSRQRPGFFWVRKNMTSSEPCSLHEASKPSYVRQEASNNNFSTTSIISGMLLRWSWSNVCFKVPRQLPF